MLNKPHDCGESRLTCSDCSAQICPSCFVQCAVGNRCKKCASRFTSHVLQVSKLHVAKASAVASVAGFAFGFLMNIVGTCGLLPLILSFGAGVLCGRLTHKAASYKLGKALSIGVFIFALGGFMLSPLGSRFLTVASLTLQPGVAEETLTMASSVMTRALLTFGLFLLALMMPFFRRN